MQYRSDTDEALLVLEAINSECLQAWTASVQLIEKQLAYGR